MRTRLIASLVSLSLSAGYAVHAQDALWFSPTPPTSSGPNASMPTLRSSDPTATAAQSFSQRFGGLLSKPAGATPADIGQPATNSPSTENSELGWPQAVSSDTHPSAGARDFRIPWSRPEGGAVPFEQATTITSKAPAGSKSVSRGAQVSALATEVKPSYVQPPRADYPTTSTQSRSRSLLATVPWGSAPRSNSALLVDKPAEDGPAASDAVAKDVANEAVAKDAVAKDAVAKDAHVPQLAQQPLQAPSLGQPASRPVTSVTAPLASPVAVANPQTTPVRPTPSQPPLAESSIQPIPTDKLLPSTAGDSVAVKRPAVTAPPQSPPPPLVESTMQPIPTDKLLPSTAGDSVTAKRPAVTAPPQPPLAESLILPVPADKVLTSMPPVASPSERRVAATLPQSHSAPPHYVLVDTQQSASDLGTTEQLAEGQAVAPAPAITNRFSDQLESVPSVAAPATVPPPVARAVPQPPPLLTTESMIGPLQGAESLFNRLEIEQDLRDVAARIESGPRGDAGNYAWMPAAYTWISPAFYHHPLYFEQPNLERYGQGPKRVLQPLASSIHFFGSIPLIPYKTLTHHPREKVYTLGSMRPGNCVPLQRGVILGPSRVGEVTMFWEECSGY